MTRVTLRVHRAMKDAFAPFRNLPEDQVEDAGSRVFERMQRELQSASHVRGPERQPSRSNRSLRRPAAALAAFAAAVVVLISATVFESAPAVLEDSNGARTIAFGERLRAIGGELKFADGSRVELRPESELSLERGRNEIRLRLHRGDVIVNAAERPEVRLQVQTEDLSAAGSVFLVSAGERGSHVAVIGGEARVLEGTAEKRLLPGEQVWTTPSLEPQTVGREVSWSSTATAHSALLLQSVPPTVLERVTFEVASIRPNGSNSTSSRLEDQPERVLISNATLEQIIRYAFNERYVRISGPPLLNSTRYDVDARAPSGTPKAQLLPMLQTLLMDRFEMRFHRETIEMPIYTLTVGKDGHRLKEIKPGEPISGAGSGRGFPSAEGLATSSFMGDLKGFAGSLARKLDRPVVDKTGLSGRFSIALAYVPDSAFATGVSGPSLFEAVQEQLGLKLEPERGPVEILVIDRLQDPAPN